MSTPPRRRSVPLPTVRGWWLVAGGIVVGVLVFLALWLGERNRIPYRADGQAPAAAPPAFRPLPTPPAGGSVRRGMPEPPPSAMRVEEPSGSASPRTVAGAQDAQDAPPRAAVAAATGLSASSPVPIESPGPRYPTRALRRGESGEVLLRIHVDARGVPAEVEVASSSGSRDLDRAAQAAARRWRFRPAMRDGTAVAGVVNVPIVFDRSD